MAATLPRILSFGKNTKALLRCCCLCQCHGEPDDSVCCLLLLQVYNENDVRRARFIGRQKEVNENFAISLVAEEPVTYVESRVVSCDGGGGAIGHPRVYINLQGCPILLLKAQRPAELSSNTLAWTFLVNLKTLINWFRVGAKQSPCPNTHTCGLGHLRAHVRDRKCARLPDLKNAKAQCP
uniref:NADH:ubiquinone oxidoreductase subunit S6 n=1 Tax=Sinocyclocheilus anshuiensis TaxID=1608454 RepID=A0A671L9R1_9TELE